MSAGSGVSFSYTDFFTLTPIAGCILDCEYGDTCGNAFSDDASQVTVSSAINPWTITASNSNIPGYTKGMCLQCTSNNAQT